MSATAKLIARLRRRHGLRRCDLARMLGVSWTTVWRWETGRRRPMGEMLDRILELEAFDDRRNKQ